MLKRWTHALGATGLGLVLGNSAALAQTAAMTAELQPGVTAKVIGIKRVPGQDIVQLDYEIANTSGRPVDVAAIGIGRTGYGLNEITLLDFPAKLSYRVGTADQCLCTQPPEQPLAAGATMKAWAWFQPPATSPGPFAVRFGSTYPIMDVPLQ